MLIAHSASQVEGRGNGIKTNIVNNVDIARALDRPPTCAPLLPFQPCVNMARLPSGARFARHSTHARDLQYVIHVWPCSDVRRGA
jgi:hypothetical protein